MLHSMTQTREKWDSLVLSRADFFVVGRCRDSPCFHFLFFCLEATVKTTTWMRMISITVMVIVSKVLFWKLLDFSYVQRSQLPDILTAAFEIYFTVEDFTDMDQHTCKFIMKWKWAKYYGNYQLYKNPSLLFEKHCTKTFTYYCIVFWLSNKPSF